MKFGLYHNPLPSLANCWGEWSRGREFRSLTWLQASLIHCRTGELCWTMCEVEQPLAKLLWCSLFPNLLSSRQSSLVFKAQLKCYLLFGALPGPQQNKHSSYSASSLSSRSQIFISSCYRLSVQTLLTSEAVRSLGAGIVFPFSLSVQNSAQFLAHNRFSMNAWWTGKK